MADSRRTVVGNAARRFWRWLVGDSWKRSLARLVVVGAAAGIAALLFVSAGLVPIAASEPHWPITRFLLHYSMIRSVQTHALGVKEPAPEERALDGDAMVLKGAGHYASGCLACHGAPGTPRAAVVRHMEPAPPYLPPKIDQWTDRQLFWIVRHGIKYTAMPAWPSQQREDEVWAMVAFLRRLPELEPAEFRRLAYGDEAALAPGSEDGSAAVRPHPDSGTGAGAVGPGAAAAALTLLESGIGVAAPHGGSTGREAVAAASLPRGTAANAPEAMAGNGALSLRLADCARCHGRAGNGRGTGAFPALAGQSERYLLESLQAYARGDRHSGVMEPVAAGLEMEEMRAIAGYYAGLPADGERAAASVPLGRIAAEAAPTGAREDVGTRDGASAARGGQLARRGDAAERIPSCVECHGPGAEARNPVYPRLAGQHPDYLALQLQLFKQGRRGGSGYAHIMRTVAKSLEPQDIRDLAAWYGSLPAEPGPIGMASVETGAAAAAVATQSAADDSDATP